MGAIPPLPFYRRPVNMGEGINSSYYTVCRIPTEASVVYRRSGQTVKAALASGVRDTGGWEVS